MKLIKSFRHALNGIRYTAKHERNFQIEIIAAVIVGAGMLIFPLTQAERSFLLIAIGVVLSLELINTAFERMLDMMKPQVHPYVKIIKDMVAGAVLLVSLSALVGGIILFLPYLWNLP